MTNDLILTKNEQRILNVADAEGSAEMESKTVETAVPIDDRVSRRVDIDAYAGKNPIFFAAGRRRRSSVIL